MSVMKNEFYNDAANRLRTPLTLIGAPVKTVLDTEPGITRKGKELLKMVADNANEMLVMLDKVQRYGNKADFHTNSGLSEEDYDLAEREKENGQIDDRNASDYLEEVNKQKEEKDEEAERLEEMGKEQKEAQEEAEHKDQTVLVVEDNADLRKFLYSILSPTYNVLLAENGKAGLVMARKETPDFILTDVTMPVMDGLSMIHEIKQDTTLNNIPVMILSAKASVEDQQRGFDEGVDAYITKPFSTPYLLGRIEAILTQRRNIQMDVIRKLKETGDKDAIAALRILPAAAPLPALNQAETSAENEAVDPNSELAFMAAQIQDRTMMRIFRFVVENAGNPELKIDDISNEIGMSRSVLYNKVKATLGGLWQGIISLKGVRNVPLYIALTLGIWLSYFFHYYLTFQCFEATSHLNLMCGLVTFIVGSIAVIVPTPNGAGPWHFAVKTMLILYGIQANDALFFVLIVHSVQTLLVVLLGIYAWIALAFTGKVRSEE